MFVGTQQTKEQKELNTRERKGQDATKITFAFADSCIQFLWSVLPICDDSADMVKNAQNRNTVKDFTEEIDEAGFVRQYNFLHLLNHIVSGSRTGCHWKMTVIVKTYYEALAFFRHTIDLELDEETMKPEKATGAPRNAGMDPGTMNMKQWYQGYDRVSDKKAPT